MLIDDDKFIPGLSEVVQVIINTRESCTANQSRGPLAFITSADLRPIGASASQPGDHFRAAYPPPKEMTVAEIEETIGAFARAAAALKRLALMA